LPELGPGLSDGRGIWAGVGVGVALVMESTDEPGCATALGDVTVLTLVGADEREGEDGYGGKAAFPCR
jgi:hypothetical protein